MRSKVTKQTTLNQITNSSRKGLYKLRDSQVTDNFNVLVINETDGKVYEADKSTFGIQSIQEGTNITINITDPSNPIISSSGGGGDGSLFPNGVELITEDTILNATHAGKILQIQSADITITMPAINPFSVGDNIGIANTYNLVNTNVILTDGAEPLLIGAELLLVTMVGYEGTTYAVPVSSNIINDDGTLKTILRYLYDHRNDGVQDLEATTTVGNITLNSIFVKAADGLSREIKVSDADEDTSSLALNTDVSGVSSLIYEDINNGGSARIKFDNIVVDEEIFQLPDKSGAGGTFAMTNDIALTIVPTTTSDTGTKGQIAIDSSFIYICIATNTWKRVAISTW